MSEYDDLLDSGIAYYKKGDYDNAIAEYTKAIRINPNSALGYQNRGDAYSKEGKKDKAITDFNKAIGIIKNQAHPFSIAGYLHWLNNEFDAAISDFTKAIDVFPSDSIYFERGYTYLKISDNDKAIADFTQAISILWQGKSSDDSFPFFHNVIKKFKENKFDSPEYQRLITSVFILWILCLCREGDSKIYQYTSQATLNEMQKSHRVRLRPASYMNDPNEGSVFYECLKEMLDEKDTQFKDIIEKIKDEKTKDSIAFIRSFSASEDSLVMWDSSYAENAKGVSIGISVKKLNKGFGLPKPKEIGMIEPNIEIPKAAASSQTEESSGFLSIEKTGLYKILYLEKGKENKEIGEIKNALLGIPQEDLENEERRNILIPLLSELFISITHLIKDISYEHEKEYRLVYIGSIEDDKTCIQSSMDTGIYIETEPILFDNQKDKEIIYFGPKVDKTTIAKVEHVVKHKGLAASIEKSKIQYK